MSPIYEWCVEVGVIRISPFIEQHTGISNAMVRNAPPFENIIDDLRQRLDDRSVAPAEAEKEAPCSIARAASSFL